MIPGPRSNVFVKCPQGAYRPAARRCKDFSPGPAGTVDTTHFSTNRWSRALQTAEFKLAGRLGVGTGTADGVGLRSWAM